MPQLTKEEHLAIIEAFLDASDRGDEKEASRLILELPMAPHLALAYKNTFGAKELLQSGFNLSEANKVYGPNWLAQ